MASKQTANLNQSSVAALTVDNDNVV